MTDAISLLNQAQSAYSAGNYEKALEVLSGAELEGKACPESMLIKAACIQLSNSTDFPVRRAFDVYADLLKVRPQDARALNEAGYFLLNIGGDPEGAKVYFERAARLYCDSLVETVFGLLKANGELGLSNEELVRSITDRFETEIERRLTEH